VEVIQKLVCCATFDDELALWVEVLPGSMRVLTLHLDLSEFLDSIKDISIEIDYTFVVKLTSTKSTNDLSSESRISIRLFVAGFLILPL
jgi:hypothetical protein